MLVTWEVLHDKFGKDEIPEITEKKRKEKLYGINNGNVALELGFKKKKKSTAHIWINKAIKSIKSPNLCTLSKAIRSS